MAGASVPAVQAVFSRARLFTAVIAVAALGVAGCTPRLSISLGQKSSVTASRSAASGRDRLIIEPNAGFSAVYNMISHAKRSIDITMYQFADTRAEHDLAAAVRRGVQVKVILDRQEARVDTAAYDYFKSHGIKVVWSWSKFTYTHQKTLTFDYKTSVIQTANLTSEYYPTSLDFLVVDHDKADVAAIVKVFDADFAHRAITPPDGADLVWSPTDSQRQILAIINGARKNLRIYSEEMGYSTVVDDLIAAARRGVDVMVCGENLYGEYTSTFRKLARAGVHISYYSSWSGFYIHGKVVLADYGTKHARVFIGSENFSYTSLNENRELGLILDSPSVISGIVGVFAYDFAHGHHVG
jgi:cardiolipin synthase